MIKYLLKYDAYIPTCLIGTFDKINYYLTQILDLAETLDIEVPNMDDDLDSLADVLAKRTEECEKISQQVKQQQEEQENKRVLPDELSTAQALIYWQRAKDKGFIDANYKFNGTNYQLTYFAKVMAEKLNLINKWKPFRDLWKYKYFSQTDREIKERFGFVKRQDEIDSIFE